MVMDDSPTGQAFFFERSCLEPLATKLAASFLTAEPFPHVVIDDFLPSDVIRSLIDSYPIATADWTQFDDPFEKVKFTQSDEEAMPGLIRHILQQFNGQVFVEFLEQLTGIKGLLPDPHFEGGGMHQIASGGFLKIHADFNEQSRLGVDRRLNALLYLNEDWEESYGGCLELWNKDMSAASQKIPPISNRLVIFATTRTSFHGHPDPLTCPEGIYRRSLALYYYTASKRIFKWRHTTLFQLRPDGGDVGATRPVGYEAVRQLRITIRAVLPPKWVDRISAMRSRITS